MDSSAVTKEANHPTQPPPSAFQVRHRDQPLSRLSQTITFEDINLSVDPVAFWTAVIDAFRLCRLTLDFGKIRDTDCGKKWTSTIDSHVHSLGVGGIDLASAIRYGVDVIDDQHVRRECRKQEDKLRRLRSDVLSELVKRPEMAGKEYKSGQTYDERVGQVLNDAHRRCTKAKDRFCREAEDAKSRVRERVVG